MSSFGGPTGGRQRFGTKVILNVYDLSPANQQFLNHIGVPVCHSGVEIDGREYTFAGGGGVFDTEPRDVPNATLAESIDMGLYEGTSADVRAAISELKAEFGPNDYNILLKNCNHFSNALVYSLLHIPIPAHVNRIANLGSMFACCIPKEMLSNAPVNEESSSSSGITQVFNNRNNSTPASTSAPTFSGGGQSLGGGTSSSSSSSSETESLIDRREKARNAALARFERGKE